MKPSFVYSPTPLRAARIAVITTGLVIIILSVVSYLRIQKLIGVSDGLHYTNKVQLELERTYSLLRDVDGALKSFLLSRDSSHYQKFRQRSATASESLASLKLMFTQSELQRELQSLDNLVRARDEVMTDLIRDDHRRNQNLQRVRAINEQIDIQIDGISLAVETQQGHEISRKEAAEKITPFLLLAIQIVIVLILFLAYRFILKELRNRQMILGELKITNIELNRSLSEMKQHKDFIEAILDSSFSLIAVYSLDGKFISFNRQCQEHFGKTADEVLGKTFPEAFPGKEDSNAYHDLRRALNGESVYSENYQAVAPGRFYQSYTTPVKDANGTPTCVVAIAHEITPIVRAAGELRKTNEALVREKEFAETILNASVDAICVFDTSLNFLSFNNAAAEIFNIRPEMLGKKFTDLYPQTIGSKTHQGLLTAVEGISTTKLRHQSVVVDKTFESFFIPLKANDRVYAVMLIHHDVTDFVQATEELNEKNKELERSNSELEQFAFVASHDLQEPLRKIQTFASMVLDEHPESAKRGEYIRKIRSSAARMSELIRNVLDFSKIRLVTPVYEDVDLNLVINHALLEQELLIKEKGGQITVTPLPVIRGSFSQLVQLFSNLLENAVKFTSKTPLISISCELVSENFTKRGPADYHKISVTDNGIGFPEKYKEQIFEVFKRLHSQSEFRGTGIGLAICKRVVSNHKGMISVMSEVGSGSTFSVYLPLVQDEQTEPVLMAHN